MSNFSLDIGKIMRAAFEQQGNGDISEIPQALVMLGSATAMAASAGANQAPPRMLAGHEQVYLVILSVLFAWGFATAWAGIWAYFDPRVRGDVGKKMLFAALVVLFVASVGLGAKVVAIKQLDRKGLQGNREFLVEVLMLSMLHHPNLVNLIGYCADGDQRLLVYEYMSLGSLEDHLHDPPRDKARLDWNTRMKIAAGAAKGLEYLHDKVNPPVIYRDLKCSNILLGEGYHPKLSDFGLAKLGPVGDKTHVSTRVMGTYGYCAPEYAMTGQLTLKSDVYSFGVVLLEIITGRRAIDNTRVAGEQNLVAWENL